MPTSSVSFIFTDVTFQLRFKDNILSSCPEFVVWFTLCHMYIPVATLFFIRRMMTGLQS